MSFGYALSQGEVGFSDLFARAETDCHIAKAQGDGISVEWSEEIERQAIDRLRARCPACGAIIECTIPRQTVPESRQLLRCPCCETSLPNG